MEKDLDMILYKEYLNGNKNAFELLYNKYKDKINYFVYNIVKDYQKAEDITQEVFIYVMQNKIKERYKFKYYIYLIAKSRAYNLLDMEQRRNKINEEYIYNYDKVEEDVADIVENIEKKKEIIEAINMLDDRYKNAIYLVNIEGLSYEETAHILGESISNIKNLIHRGKKELRKILIKKGYDEMNKLSKVIIAILCIGIVLAGGVYAAVKVYEKFSGKVRMEPTYTSIISEVDTNKVWVGTFNLVWNDFMNEYIKGKIEFEDGPSKLADELNKQSFTVDELSENSYYKKHGEPSYELKNEIENGIKLKFNEQSEVLDKVNWDDPDGYVLYAMLKKEFNFLKPFSNNVGNMNFNNDETLVKCFGTDYTNNPEAKDSIEVLFYNSKDDFAVKLKTKEKDEVILYKTDGINKSFEDNFKELNEKESNYNEEKKFTDNDVLRVPFIKVHDDINYDELCGRLIKGTNGIFINQALQTIDFDLNESGGSVKSEALIEAREESVLEPSKSGPERLFIFDSDFILYLKEEGKEKPYFALKVDDLEVLVPFEYINPIAGETETNIETESDYNLTKTEVTKPIKNEIKEEKDDKEELIINDNEDPMAILPVVVNPDEEDGIITFIGTIERITEMSLFINPVNDDERLAGTTILVKNDGDEKYQIGKMVKVSFKGNITKTSPQNINLVSIELMD